MRSVEFLADARHFVLKIEMAWKKPSRVTLQLDRHFPANSYMKRMTKKGNGIKSLKKITVHDRFKVVTAI